MEQLYLIEIFIDKVYIFASKQNEESGANKNLIIKIKFGPKVQFIIREQAQTKSAPKDVIECDEHGRRKFGRPIRNGKSYLFPSYSDTVLMILEKFPLEIEVWNDDEKEVEIFVGVGTMLWDTQFFLMLKETANADSLNTALTVKSITTLTDECCCKQVGEIVFILRISALGDSIVTEYQQLMTDPESFVFRTNKTPSLFTCKRVDGNDKNFTMVGNLYESTTLEDPAVLMKAQQKIEICTDIQSCADTPSGSAPVCKHTQKQDEEEYKNKDKKKYAIDQIRMGDIHGPCGNSNCPLAHKVRNYIRNLETYKQEAAGKVSGNKSDTGTKKVCGGCCCKDDRFHREECPDNQNKATKKTLCTGCDGVVPVGNTCEDKKKKIEDVLYVFSVHQLPGYKESMLGRNFIEENMDKDLHDSHLLSEAGPGKPATCGCRKSCRAQTKISHAICGPDSCASGAIQPARSIGTNSTVYNVEVNKEITTKANQPSNYQQCTDIPDEKDCKCEPTIPAPPCRTFDCDCLSEFQNIAARKAHKSYCPLYKHKSNCPVTMMNEEEPKVEDDEDAAEPLPYGLPPVQLGPCPIMGRPCSVPDGFAKMYKNAQLPTLPPSYDDAGKVCCSKEYERIKKALKDYMTYEKENDFRCLNKFNVDTERRCCDKEQKLLALLGRGCCGSHKMDIQEKFKNDIKK